ncbi:MAG: transporter [Betaproteobacteria bacterium]
MRLPTLLSRAVAAVLLAVAAHADAAPARVDFLESPAVIGLGQWQFDPVFPTLRATTLQAARVAAPGPLASATMELRAAATSPADGLAMESATDRVRRLHGFSDVSLGARWRVRGGDAGWLPGVAWLADVEATMGSPAFRGRHFRPSLRATAEWTLPQQMTLCVMPGVYRDRGDDGRHYAAGVLAVTLGKAWTPRLQTFVELAGQRQSRAQSDGSLLDVDTGLAFTATKTLQLDVVVSRSLAGGASQATRGGLSVSSRF